MEPLSFLWRAGVILVGAFGLPGLSVGSSLLLFVVSLARLGCLWARGSFWDRFLIDFLLILQFVEESGGGF